MPPLVTSDIIDKTCNTCNTYDEECTWRRQDDQCDRCIDHGILCRISRSARASSIEVKGEGASTPASTSEPEPAPAAYRNYLKCDTCRRHHQTCRPLGRKWPEKCERCIEKGWDCTPPRSKKDYENESAQGGRMRRRRVRRSTAGKYSQQQGMPPNGEHTNGMLMPIDPDESDHAEDREAQSELSDREPDPSSIVTGRPPPAKRQRTGGGDEGKAAAATPSTYTATDGGAAESDLQKTIRTMEEEFQEVLRAEHERHDAQIRSIQAKHEQELAQQRERYEGRIDDLIKIMKSIGRVD